MRLCSIASGSSGNCIYTGGEHTHLLVDTGISKKRVEEGLKALNIKGDELSGILITHEHIDHVQGLGVFSRKYADLCDKRYDRRNQKDFQYWKDAGRIIP